MNILGIDPGTARMGWGLVITNGNQIFTKNYGCIFTEDKFDLPERLHQIYQKLVMLLDNLKPDCMAIEEIFFATNAKTVIPVAQARGIALLSAAQKKIPVYSYSPLAIKKTICGNGNANKIQIQNMITRILKFNVVPKPDDVADALAIALTHAYSYKFKEKIK